MQLVEVHHMALKLVVFAVRIAGPLIEIFPVMVLPSAAFVERLMELVEGLSDQRSTIQQGQC